MTGKNNYYKKLVAHRGPYEAAKFLLTEDMRTGIRTVALEETLEAEVVKPQYRCLFTDDEIGTALYRIRLLGVRDVSPFVEVPLPDWKLSCSCEDCPEGMALNVA